MTRAIAFLLLGVITGSAVYLRSDGNILLAAVVGSLASVFGFAKEILEPIKQIYEIRKIKLEIAEKKRQQEQERRRTVDPTPQEVGDLGKPYREVPRNLLSSTGGYRAVTCSIIFPTTTRSTLPPSAVIR
jgi:hypothetical protein